MREEEDDGVVLVIIVGVPMRCEDVCEVEEPSSAAFMSDVDGAVEDDVVAAPIPKAAAVPVATADDDDEEVEVGNANRCDAGDESEDALLLAIRGVSTELILFLTMSTLDDGE